MTKTEIDEQRDEILRDALDQYVTNIDLEDEETSLADRVRYNVASAMLDELNNAFVVRMGAL